MLVLVDRRAVLERQTHDLVKSNHFSEQTHFHVVEKISTFFVYVTSLSCVLCVCVCASPLKVTCLGRPPWAQAKPEAETDETPEQPSERCWFIHPSLDPISPQNHQQTALLLCPSLKIAGLE